MAHAVLLLMSRSVKAAEYCVISRDNRTIYYGLTATEADVWLMRWE
jgi:hypothetical protein